MRNIRATAIVNLTLLALSVSAFNSLAAGGNLIVNGSFDDPTNSMKGWCYNYEWEENRNYANNHKSISVVPSENGKKNVLKMNVRNAGSAGTKIDSSSVKYEKGSRYRFTASIRSTGPGNRIYVAGYQWKPGIKPYDNPSIWDLREVYRTDAFPHTETLGESWKQVNGEFPASNLSELAQQHLKKVTFLVIHIIAIMGKNGEFCVDDVVMRKM